MRVLSFLLFATALAGCERVSADRAEAQLVARVNGVEISARELRTGNVAQAVERIIDRELLVQKALEAGLEREPLVKDSIDNARRQVLAQAWLAAELDALAAWLKARNARFSAATETQAAEQLPLAFLPQLARMKAGEIAVFGTPPGAQVVQLIHAEEAPLGLEQSQALIEQFLAGKKRLEIAAAEVKRLRESARIEYVAQFKR